MNKIIKGLKLLFYLFITEGIIFIIFMPIYKYLSIEEGNYSYSIIDSFYGNINSYNSNTIFIITKLFIYISGLSVFLFYTIKIIKLKSSIEEKQKITQKLINEMPLTRFFTQYNRISIRLRQFWLKNKYFCIILYLITLLISFTDIYLSFKKQILSNKIKYSIELVSKVISFDELYILQEKYENINNRNDYIDLKHMIKDIAIKNNIYLQNKDIFNN